MADTTKYISQVTLPGSDGTYNIKDASAWSAIGKLWSTISQGTLELVVLGPGDELPTASESTKGKIYLKPDTTHNPSTNDVYDEYVTVKKGTNSYEWEKIGNTDVNLNQYSLKTHTHTVNISIGVKSHSYTPKGTVSNPTFTGTKFDSSGNYTPKGTVETDTTESKSATVSATSGAATYTPAGTVEKPDFTGTEGDVTVSGTVNSATGSGTAASAGTHTHSVSSTTKYLHSIKVPTGFSTTAVLTDVSTSKLNTTKITGAKGTDTVHDTPTLVTTKYGSASDWNEGSASDWSFSVASETLTISGGNGTAPSLTITDVSVGTGLQAGTSKTFAIAADSATTVATGFVSTVGKGATVAISAGSTTNAYTGISSSTASFTLDTTASDGSAVITSVNASTGSAGAHTHSLDVSVGNVTVQSTGKFTPAGTVSAPAFTGTGVRLVTGDIAVPKTYTFSGTAETITVSGTATGTVSAPTFTGEAATLQHTVDGNGPATTSQASA